MVVRAGSRMMMGWIAGDGNEGDQQADWQSRGLW